MFVLDIELSLCVIHSAHAVPAIDQPSSVHEPPCIPKKAANLGAAPPLRRVPAHIRPKQHQHPLLPPLTNGPMPLPSQPIKSPLLQLQISPFEIKT
jgi:hypothetical protein